MIGGCGFAQMALALAKLRVSRNSVPADYKTHNHYQRILQSAWYWLNEQQKFLNAYAAL